MLLKRLACLNGLVCDVRTAAARTVHLGGQHHLERLLPRLEAQVKAALVETPVAFEAYYGLRDTRLANPAQALEDLAPVVGLGKRAAEGIRDERLARYVTELGPTAYALVNSVTEAARDEKAPAARDLLNKAAEALITLPARRWEPHLN